jgi:hypothetical protein
MLQVPMRFEDEKLLWVVDDVLTATDGAEHVRWIEEQSPRAAE